MMRVISYPYPVLDIQLFRVHHSKQHLENGAVDRMSARLKLQPVYLSSRSMPRNSLLPMINLCFIYV